MVNTITPTIVSINATIARAPQASQLQQSGAFVSVGGSTLTAGTYQYVSQLSDVTALLSSTGNHVELANEASTFFAQGNAVGAYILELGSSGGETMDADIAALQAWITANPGVFYAYLCPAAWGSSIDEVGSIVITNGGSGYTVAPAVTISAPSSGVTATAVAVVQNGVVVSINITEAGSGYTSTPTVTIAAPSSGTTATGTANLASAINTLAAQYSSPSGKTYFFVESIAADLPAFATNKAVFAVTKSPTSLSTEFQTAAFFYDWLVNKPSSSNKLAPMAYRYLYAVTPWVQAGNSAAINSILTNYGNLVGTGAEGGISNAISFKGTLMDGTQASWWYGVDWFQIQVKQALAAAVINGSNSNPPLLYDQDGINYLLKVAQQVGQNAVTFGCALSVEITAVPFFQYQQENPSSYNAGYYGGFAATIVGQNGFLTLTFNLEAVQFVA